MFDPHCTRKNNSRYYTKKGQINQATITDTPIVINPKHVNMYLEYMLANGIVSNNNDTPRPSPTPTPDPRPEDYVGLHYIRNYTSQPLYFYCNEVNQISFLNPGQNFTIEPPVPSELLPQFNFFFNEGMDLYLNNFTNYEITNYFIVRNNSSDSIDTRTSSNNLSVGGKHYYSVVRQHFRNDIYHYPSNKVEYLGFVGNSDIIPYNVNYEHEAIAIYPRHQDTNIRDLCFSLEMYQNTDKHKSTIAVFIALPTQ